jgi:aspartate carbamoyltransferase catalytic subunit
VTLARATHTILAMPPRDRPVHLTALHGLPAEHLRHLLRGAIDLMPTALAHGTAPARHPTRTIATMFFEDSTRTRSSFTLAAQRLGAHAVDLSGSTSSVNKGESLIDTARTIEAMGVDVIVVRARQSGAADLVARHVRCAVVNAGDGRHEHPTQGLLDAAAFAEAHRRQDTLDFRGLKLVIVGDAANSRVARSAIAAFATLGARIECVGPPSLAPVSLAALGCDVSRDLDAALPTADAVMMLRIQFERSGDAPKGPPLNPDAPRNSLITSVREYRAGYALTREREAILKPGAVVMHPGPMNRGLEIDPEVADGPRSIILRQVTWGVAVRMSVLDHCLRG